MDVLDVKISLMPAPHSDGHLRAKVACNKRHVLSASGLQQVTRLGCANPAGAGACVASPRTASGVGVEALAGGPAVGQTALTALLQ